jgi:1,4-alpha-glucan branching enzyme
MGNEFGHPEWIDFPREDRVEASTGKFIPGNGNSFHLCRRRFDLADMDHLRYKFMNRFDSALNSCEDALQFLSSSHQYVSKKDNGDKMVVFERGDAVFVFNWHPTRSYENYRVGCLKPGKYTIALNSDEPDFGGYDNVKSNVEFFATDMPHDGRPASFQVYAPARTVVVYALDTLTSKVDRKPNPTTA